MKLQVDNELIFELQEWQEKVIQNDIAQANFKEDMKRRARYIWEHKFEQCFKRLKHEWEPKLALERSTLPTNEEEFAALVFSHPDYQSRSEREEQTAQV